MAGIAYGINKLAVGPGEARRRSLQPQTTPDTNNNDANNPDTDKIDTNNIDTKKTDTDTDGGSNSESSEEFGYVNSAKQDIKGLTNLTGYVKGNANGVINFGTLTASDPNVEP